MYRVVKYRLGTSIDTEIHYVGKYGRKGEKRAPKKKATPEQMQKQNKWKKEVYLRRLIQLNFVPYDLFCTLKYPAGTRIGAKQVQSEVQRFIKKLRLAYQKQDVPLKYIYRIEIGKRGGIHVHMIINRLPKDGDKVIQEKWIVGRVNFTNLYDQGGYADLAEYMAKEPPEEMEGQISMFEESERKKLRSYNPSRNLKKPEAEVKEYKRRTVRKILEEGPIAEEGFYVDKSSIRQGVNPYTGCSYLYYTEHQVKKVPWEIPWGMEEENEM